MRDASRSNAAEDPPPRRSLLKLFSGLRRPAAQEPPKPSRGNNGVAGDVAAILENVHQLHDMRISDAMVPRADIIAVEGHSSLTSVIEIFREAGHSRLPVYRDTLDDPLGFVHLKDIFLAFASGEITHEKFSLDDFLRRVLTVPPSMRVNILMQRMQAARIHMALVIDEFGGVDGLVTNEDLIELVVGEIEDEHDTEEEFTWEAEAAGSYLTDARLGIDAFEERTGISLLNPRDEEEVDTMGGLVVTLSGRVPHRGEVIQHGEGHEFEIVDADARRVKCIRVTPVRPVSQAAAE